MENKTGRKGWFVEVGGGCDDGRVIEWCSIGLMMGCGRERYIEREKERMTREWWCSPDDDWMKV